MSLIILQQTLTMLLLMGAGVVLTRIGILNDAASSALGKLLVSCIIPCMTLNSFMVPMKEGGLGLLGQSAVLGIASLAIAMAVSYIIFPRKAPEQDFGAAFSNASFVGIPLVSATVGGEAVFYIAPMISFLNILQWTYGEWLLTGDSRKVQLKTVLLNPVLIATVIGIIFYAAQLPVPGIVGRSIEMLADTNTPLAMLVLGSYLAKTLLRSLVADARVWIGSAVRLFVVPLAMTLLIKLSGIGGSEMVQALFSASAAPVGANVAIFAQQCGADYGLSARLVCLSTLLSALSVPIVFQLFSRLV
ncbi:MAG: AEC family transporter [Olsenella sp.]|nr:AEC family transporter [Olsenella sp.]MCH3957258.1 AEC family transporter [Olsenella sp.]MCI2126633.1 AEC family transporter [Olsenella sp.]